MAEQPPTSPFAALGSDKALLRPTRPRPEVTAAPAEAIPTSAPITEAEPPATPEPAQSRLPRRSSPAKKPSTTPRRNDTKVSRHHDTEIPRYQGELIQEIRRVVFEPGREAATLRLSAEEKDRLAQVIHEYRGYRRQGRRTSETDIIRIALNFLLQEHEAHGEESILSQVMEALVS